MEPIHVPGAPREAFHKNRRISDLIRAQTNHLKHVEEKLPPTLREQIPRHAIVSEQDAANYIAAMTRILRARGDTVATAAAQTPPGAKEPIPIRPAPGLDLAAGGQKEASAPSSKSSAAKTPAKSKDRKPSRKGKKG